MTSGELCVLAKLAPLADVEDHHPDVRIFNYRHLEVSFTTRSIGCRRTTS
ncbi:MAG: 4a-hydroxytetrahydrobiopterin dehydratase [Deltaproteobacteria bacterium]|nr:4a-hydroxytetrahydrobiopterin dehydratase [Deltaproteobacteria bacterium]